MLLGKYYVEVPILDQWWLLPLLVLQREGRLTLADIWLQNAEHRMFFPKLIMLLLARWTSWDLRYEVAINFFLTVVGSFAMGAYLWRLRNVLESSALTLPLAVLSLVLFSPAPFENWLWSWQVPYFLVQLSVIVCVICLSLASHTSVCFVFAVASTIVASFSFASGLVIWGAGLSVIIMNRNQPYQLPRGLIWTVSGMVTLIIYLFDYKFLDWTSPSGALRRTSGFILYTLTYLGAGISAGMPSHIVVFTGMLFVILVLCLACLFTKSSVRARWALAPFWGLIVFSMGTALLTALGRSNVQPWTQALSPRYITFSQLGWLAGYVCFWGLSSEQCLSNTTQLLCKTVARVLVCGFLYMWWFGIRGMVWFSAEMAERRTILLNSSDYGELRRVYVVPQQLATEFRPLLQKYQLSLFRAAQQR